MTPYEILLSRDRRSGCWSWRSPAGSPEIQAVCAKWELAATPIGQVTDDGIFRVRHDGLGRRGDSRPAPGRRLPDLRSRGPGERGRAEPPRRVGRPARPSADLAAALRAAARRAQPRQQAVGLRAVRLDRAGLHRARSRRGRRRAPGARHRRSGWRSPSTATTVSSRSIPTRAARPRWPRRRATSPAPAPGRSASPIASTSATRRSRRSSSSSARPAAASPTPAARSTRR